MDVPKKDVGEEKFSHEVTRLLHDWSTGNAKALRMLMPLVLEDLRQLARRYMRREGPSHTLQATALVNEVYLRLQGRRSVSWQNRAHFFGFAAQTMRRILVDHARGQQADKRGNGLVPISIENPDDLPLPDKVDLVALDDALEILTNIDPRQAKIVELRFFVGLTVEETAEVLEISTATVKREWRIAKLWLFRELENK